MPTLRAPTRSPYITLPIHRRKLDKICCKTSCWPTNDWIWITSCALDALDHRFGGPKITIDLLALRAQKNVPAAYLRVKCVPSMCVCVIISIAQLMFEVSSMSIPAPAILPWKPKENLALKFCFPSLMYSSICHTSSSKFPSLIHLVCIACTRAILVKLPFHHFFPTLLRKRTQSWYP